MREIRTLNFAIWTFFWKFWDPLLMVFLKNGVSKKEKPPLFALWLTCLPGADFRLWIWALLSALLLLLPQPTRVPSPPPQRLPSFCPRHPFDVGLTDTVPLTPFQQSQQTNKALALVGLDGGQALAMVRGLIASQHQGD